MKYASFVLGVALALAVNAFALPEERSESASQDLTRVCIPVSGTSTTLTVAGTSASTSALAGATVHEIVCDVAVYWCVGDDANCTATSSHQYLPANVPRYFGTSVNGAISDRVAALDVSTDGTCWIRACR